MGDRLPENCLGSNTELRLIGEQESRSIPYHASWLPGSCYGDNCLNLAIVIKNTISPRPNFARAVA